MYICVCVPHIYGSTTVFTHKVPLEPNFFQNKKILYVSRKQNILPHTVGLASGVKLMLCWALHMFEEKQKQSALK